MVIYCDNYLIFIVIFVNNQSIWYINIYSVDKYFWCFSFRDTDLFCILSCCRMQSRFYVIYYIKMILYLLIFFDKWVFVNIQHYSYRNINYVELCLPRILGSSPLKHSCLGWSVSYWVKWLYDLSYDRFIFLDFMFFKRFIYKLLIYK